MKLFLKNQEVWLCRLLLIIEYEDGTTKRITYPAQVWRKNDKEVKKLITSNKKIININLDPDLETADIDTSNNSWPKKQDESEFDKFKSKGKRLIKKGQFLIDLFLYLHYNKIIYDFIY